MGFKKEKKFKHILHVYIPEEFQSFVEEAKKICDREGESLSKKVVEFCCNYANLHRHGNPQTLMESYTQEKLDNSPKKCDIPECGSNAVYRCKTVFPIKPVKNLCKSCCTRFERHNEIISKVELAKIEK